MQVGLPLLVIIALDFGFWPHYVDHHFNPPFFKNISSGEIVDSNGTVVQCYPDIPAVLDVLQTEKIKIGVTSFTTNPNGTKELLDALNFTQYISYFQLSTRTAYEHLQRIQKESGVAKSDMLFFDSWNAHIRDSGLFGVLGVKMENGMHMGLMVKALNLFKAFKTNQTGLVLSHCNWIIVTNFLLGINKECKKKSCIPRSSKNQILTMDVIEYESRLKAVIGDIDIYLF